MLKFFVLSLDKGRCRHLSDAKIQYEYLQLVVYQFVLIKTVEK